MFHQPWYAPARQGPLWRYLYFEQSLDAFELPSFVLQAVHFVEANLNFAIQLEQQDFFAQQVHYVLANRRTYYRFHRPFY